MKDSHMEIGSTVQHDLRREFHNMIGILKIIKHEDVIQDNELKAMLELCLEREKDVAIKFDQLTEMMEKISE